MSKCKKPADWSGLTSLKIGFDYAKLTSREVENSFSKKNE